MHVHVRLRYRSIQRMLFLCVLSIANICWLCCLQCFDAVG